MDENEDFLNAIDVHMGSIQWVYKQYEDNKPVMVLDFPSNKLYAYPYEGWLEMLSERSQKALTKEYTKAVSNNQMLVFVRDNDAKTLKSRSLPIEEITIDEGLRRDLCQMIARHSA